MIWRTTQNGRCFCHRTDEVSQTSMDASSCPGCQQSRQKNKTGSPRRDKHHVGGPHVASWHGALPTSFAENIQWLEHAYFAISLQFIWLEVISRWRSWTSSWQKAKLWLQVGNKPLAVPWWRRDSTFPCHLTKVERLRKQGRGYRANVS